MLRGFPSDFPTSPTAEDGEKELIACGLFIRSDISEIVLAPAAKKPRIEDLSEPTKPDDNKRRVKFSAEPPEEYFTFPDCDYDRSSFGGKLKRYLIHAEDKDDIIK